MTRLTRNFMLGSTAIVLVGLGTGLVAYYNGGLPMGFSAAPDELSYMPEGTNVVAHAAVSDIMKSEFRKHVQQALPTGEEKQKLQSETGIDLERDIDSVAAGFQGGKGNGRTTLVLIRGRFDEAKVAALATEHGGQVVEYKGHKLVVAADTAGAGSKNGDRLTGGVAFLSPNLIALGASDEIEHAIDAHETGQNMTKDAEMMKFVSEVDKNSNAWVAGRFDALATTGAMPAAAADRLAAVQWFAVTAHVDDGISGVIRADARDDQSAENLRDIVRGGLAAVRLMSGQNPKLEAAVNSLQLSGTGKTISVSFIAPPEVLDMLNGVAGLANLTGVKKIVK